MINLDTLEIEIVNTEPIDGGVQVFARAWSDGVQIGFGKDGTVDIERFRIFNPPVLVDDPTGDIVQEWTDKDGIIHTRTLLEDPEQALLQSLANIISSLQSVSLEGNIEIGKIGNTTTTVYPTSDRNITSGAPTLNRNLNPMYVQRNSGDSYRAVFAITVPADPGSQQIDSVSFSVIYQGQSGTHTTVELVEITQATFDITTCTWNIYKTATNWTTAGGDFGSVIDTRTPTTGTNTWVVTGAGADNPLTLAWGQALNLLLKYTNDISSPATNWWAMYAEEQTGTSSDPFLTIEHTTASGDVTVSPAAQALTASIPAYSVKKGVTQAPAAQSIVASIPAYGVAGKAVVSPVAQSIVASIPTYTISSGGNIAVAVAAQSIVSSIPAYSVLLGTVFSPSAQALTINPIAPTISLTGNVVVSPEAQTATFSLPTPTITAVESSVIIAVATQLLTLSLPTIAITAGVWTKRARETSATWNRRPFNDN